MSPGLRRKLLALAERHEEVGRLLAEPSVIADNAKFRALSREFSQLQPVAEPDRPQTPPAAHAARVWPQFRVVPGGIAAPAPSSLQPLRAWLPDAEEPEADAHHGVGSAADPLPLAS